MLLKRAQNRYALMVNSAPTTPSDGGWQNKKQESYRGDWSDGYARNTATPSKGSGKRGQLKEAKGGEQPASKKQKQGGGEPNKKPLEKMKCFRCKQFGHLIADCPQKE